MGWPGRQGSPASIRAVGELLATPAFGRGFLSHPATSALELYGGRGGGDSDDNHHSLCWAQWTPPQLPSVGAMSQSSQRTPGSGPEWPLEALTTGHGGTPCRQHHPTPTHVKGGKGFCLPTRNHRRNPEGQVCQSSGTQYYRQPWLWALGKDWGWPASQLRV